MKKLITNILMTIVFLCVLPNIAMAEEVEIDGIKYSLVKKLKEATVIKKDVNYSGNVIIPSTVEYEGIEYDVISIGNEAFYNCGNLFSIEIPNSITSIGTYAFWVCNNLKSVEIPNSVTSIGSGAFSSCNKLSSVILPSNLTNLSSSIFSKCKSLSSIDIPNSVTIIGSSAFSECTSLTTIDIPSNVTEIESYAFNECSNLVSIILPVGLKTIGPRCFYKCSNLSSIDLPHNLESINYCAFGHCSGLTSIVIPNSLKKIEDYAFYDCSALTSINIGSGIRSIGYGSFANCSDIETFTIYASIVPQIVGDNYNNTDVFNNSYIEYSKLIVPDESIDAYKSKEPWSRFGTIEGLSGHISEKEKCATPTINYANGKITIECETEGVTYQSTITNPDVASYYGNEINLGGYYYVKVYATKEGYEDSDEATATINLLEGASSGIIGDVNGDGLINMMDVTEIINTILGK